LRNHWRDDLGAAGAASQRKKWFVAEKGAVRRVLKFASVIESDGSLRGPRGRTLKVNSLRLVGLHVAVQGTGCYAPTKKPSKDSLKKNEMEKRRKQRSSQTPGIVSCRANG
jgi:hypothetical protein